MDLAKRLDQVTVIGAGGKMGSGIALLLALEMTRRRLAAKAPDAAFRLNLIDTHPEALRGLFDYVRTQSVKSAEKMITQLRPLFAERADIVENGEVINEFVTEVTRSISLSTDLASARNSHLVFEAIVENEDIKVGVYKRLRELCSPDAFFLTNTSSIPIHVLDEKADLGGRILGYHFYNPPPVQKLVEVITTKATRKDLVDVANELGKVLRKTLIPANDVAGFIGNGHFTRDGLHGLEEVERLHKDGLSFVESVYLINKVSQDLLVRPMGIFQLIDYVGVDVFKCILDVISGYLPGAPLRSPLIDAMIAKGVKGGQFASGAQKDGFLRYDKSGVAGIYDLESGKYMDLDRSQSGWCAKVDARLGALPAGWMPWKKWIGQPKRETSLMAYLDSFWQLDSAGARMARSYLLRSAEIAEGLVKDGVANNIDDVNGVLLNGFYHAYGPVNEVTRKRLAESVSGKVTP